MKHGPGCDAHQAGMGSPDFSCCQIDDDHDKFVGGVEDGPPDRGAMRIEHDLMPGFVMEVLDVRPCEPDDEPHSAYKIVDPEGHEDWLCGHDVTVL